MSNTAPIPFLDKDPADRAEPFDTNLSQMTDIADVFIPGIDLYGDTGLSEENCLQLHRLALDTSNGDLRRSLQKHNYTSEELSDLNLSFLRVGVMTPALLYTQNRLNAVVNGKRDREQVRIVCEFNRALQDVMNLGPDLSKASLTDFLEESYIWAGLEGNQTISRMKLEGLFNILIAGAANECNLDRFGDSEAFQNANISVARPRVDADLSGIDRILKISNAKGDVIIKVDVKSNYAQLLELSPAEQRTSHYAIRADGLLVLAMDGFSDHYAESLVISEGSANEKAPKLLTVIAEATKELGDDVLKKYREGTYRALGRVSSPDNKRWLAYETKAR